MVWKATTKVGFGYSVAPRTYYSKAGVPLIGYSLWVVANYQTTPNVMYLNYCQTNVTAPI